MGEKTFGGKMELLKLSRFKLQLRTLISELKDLRDRERSSTDQLHLSIQKQKQLEEEFGRKVKELEAELASSIESRQKLERKVSYLQNDNVLLENKQKELNGTVQSLLQSREHFVNVYQDSSCEMKRSIETRERKLKVFSEKLKSHLLLFDSIEKEAVSVKQVVDNVRHVVIEKEEIVTGLKRKFDRVSEIEKLFIGKISEMEIRLEKCKNEILMKDELISELEAKLAAKQVGNCNQARIEELQKTLSTKEATIHNLISEKQSLESEVKSLGAVLEKIQESLGNVNEVSCPRCIEDSKVNIRKDPESQPPLGNSVARAADFQPNLGDAYRSVEMPETNEPVFHAEESACSGPHSTVRAQTTSSNEAKSNCTITLCLLESECSTTQAETSEHPG